MMKKLMNRIGGVSRNENGSISMYMIIFMVFFLPFAIWVGVQLPLKYEAQYEIKQMTSNTADSMISRLDEDALASGQVKVDVAEAMGVADSMIRETLNLDGLGNPSGEGILKEQIPIYGPYTILDLESLPAEEGVGYVLPEEKGVYIYIVNNPNHTIQIKGLLPIDKTSVIVRANIPVKNGGLLGGRAVVHKTGVSEARIQAGTMNP